MLEERRCCTLGGEGGGGGVDEEDKRGRAKKRGFMSDSCFTRSGRAAAIYWSTTVRTVDVESTSTASCLGGWGERGRGRKF